MFVPAPWSDKRVVLKPAEGQNWSEASVEGERLERGSSGEWAAESVRAGAWNTVAVDGGTTAGARLVASGRLHIQSLEASGASERSLSVRVRLSEGARGMVTIILTLTAPDGRQTGGTEVTLGRKTRDLSVELPLVGARSGQYRLKATLVDGDQVVDNARTEVKI